MMRNPRARLFELLAEALDYPSARSSDCASECVEVLTRMNPAAAEQVARFAESVKKTSPEKLEEVYSATFDLQPACYPYVGYQLFGESYKRGAFLANLKHEYKECGFSEGKELPDHVAVILRFLASAEESELTEELTAECLVPALEKMLQGFSEKGNPYREVLSALLTVLTGLSSAQGRAVERATEGGMEHE